MHRNEYNQDLDLITTFTGDQADKLIEVLTTPVGLGEELDLGGITDDDSEN